MNTTTKKMMPVWCIGFVLLALRLVEKMIGFDGATGLAVPTPVRYALVGATVLGGLYTVFAGRKLPKERPDFMDHFYEPDKAKGALVLGCFLMIGGGVWMGYQTVMNHAGIAPLVTAVLAVLTGCGLLALTKKMGEGEADSVAPLLPALFFGAFWVLSLYLPTGNDPILAHYWLPILAAAMAAYAFAQLSGFFRRESKVRNFSLIARLAVMLCIAAVGDMNVTHGPLFAGSAVVLSVFLTLEKE